jgi:serine/threonine-protein kinase
MEFVHGVPLDLIIAEHAEHNTVVPLARALSILQDVASGLDEVHRAGLVHRDIKPANLMIEDGTGRPVLIDFGLVISTLPGEDAEHALWGGTPEYLAPEQAAWPIVLPAADLYSFACTAFELLTGALPFVGNTVGEMIASHARAAPRSAESLRPELKGVDSVFLTALAKEPGERYSTAGEFVAALRAALPGGLSAWPGLGAVDDRGAGLAALDRPRSPVADKTTILVIDDDAVFRTFAARAVALTFLGEATDIQTAASGAEAVRIARDHAPKVIILDYDMPDVNGVETLAALREGPSGDEARVIVCSASAGEKERWRFAVLGVREFLKKPVAFPDLVRALESTARSAKLKLGTVPNAASSKPRRDD